MGDACNEKECSDIRKDYHYIQRKGVFTIMVAATNGECDMSIIAGILRPQVTFTRF